MNKCYRFCLKCYECEQSGCEEEEEDENQPAFLSTRHQRNSLRTNISLQRK
ncbi:hypothetical protein PAMP_002746 [Pampus punctatissimus]